MRSRLAVLLASVFSIVFATAAFGQVATALISQGEPLAGDMLGTEIISINNPATNGVGGFAFTVNTGPDATFNNIWGNPVAGPGTVLQAEQTVGDLTITSFESFFGMSDAGDVFYGTSTTSAASGETGLDGVFLNDFSILNEEEPIASLPGFFSTFNSRPGITFTGMPYWVGGVSTTQGGGTQQRVLFKELSATPVLMGGDTIVGITEPLQANTGIDFDVRFSAAGTNYILVSDLESSAAINTVVVLNGEAATVGGAVLREGTVIPSSSGGNGVETWDNFDFLGIRENGGFMVTGDSDAAALVDEFVLIDGEIVLREGDAVNGGTLNGSIEGAFLNEDGDWAVTWDYDVGADNFEVLIVNGEVVLAEGDAVDLNGDGIISSADNGAVLEDFNGISSLNISRRDAMGDIRAYFVADVDVGDDSVEVGFEMTVNVATIIKGDVNMDGVVNLLDVGPFIDAISGTFVAEADTNCDGVVNLLDVGPFIDLLNGG